MRKDRIIAEVLGEEQALTPSEVCTKQFKRAVVGGYVRDEVHAYLARVADVLESLVGEIRALKERQEEHKTRLEEFRQMEAALRSALTSSQKFADNMVESARREAEVLREQAQLERTKAQLEAEKLPETIAAQVRRLEEQRGRLRAELGAMLDAHRRLLDGLDDHTDDKNVLEQAAEALPAEHDDE